MGGADVTRSLRATGLTDEQGFKTFAACMNDNGDTAYFCGISKAQKDAVERLGPRKVAKTALWQQTFAANKEIEVRHVNTRPSPANISSIPINNRNTPTMNRMTRAIPA